MKTIKAKFRVHNITPWGFANQAGEFVKTGEKIQLSPVYSDDKTSENYSFSQATPSGTIELGITNPDAYGAFVEGQEYYIDFTPA